MRALGTDYGLVFLEGEEAFRKSIADWGGDQYLEQLEKIPAPFKRLLLSNVHWRLEGEHKGFRVTVYPETRQGRKSPTMYTVARVFYRQGLDYELTAAREGFLARLGKAVLGLQDVTIGDEDFDEEIRIKTSDPEAAKLLLCRPEIRSAIMKLTMLRGDFEIEKTFVQWESLGSAAGKAEVSAALAALVRVAAAMGR